MRSGNRLGWGFSYYLPTKVYDDDKYQFAGLRIDSASTRYSYDSVNIGVSFHANARYPEEIIFFPAQMSHAWKLGSTVYPHIHWIQEQAAVPNFLLEYRIIANGQPATGAFTFSVPSGNAFPYTSGSILQITSFPPIDMSAINSVSAFIDTKFYRDTANTSGQFSGVDPVLTAVTVKEYDNHILKDTIGSKEIFEK